MAYSAPITFVALQVLTAAQLNGIQDNITALWPFTTAGDLAYATSASALTRRGIGANGQVLTVVAGVPTWGVNEAFKIGDIHVSTIATNPATTLGYGTWEAFGSGRILLGDGGGYAAGDTGGEATHTLNTAEMPAHTHTVVATKWFEDINGPTSGSAFGTCDTDSTITSSSAGSGSAHNNLQPYVVVYFWKRTA
jgi:hypothetical protein